MTKPDPRDIPTPPTIGPSSPLGLLQRQRGKDKIRGWTAAALSAALLAAGCATYGGGEPRTTSRDRTIKGAGAGAAAGAVGAVLAGKREAD